MFRPPLSARRLAKLIWLSSVFTNYQVNTSGWNGIEPFAVERAAEGHYRVRKLRDMASRRPDLFPIHVLALHEWAKIHSAKTLQE
jgi:hypothetical protein